MSDDLGKHCMCGCIYLEAKCPNCNKVSDTDRIEALEAKLAKAVEALDKIKRIDNLVGVFAACERTLAELTGAQKDGN